MKQFIYPYIMLENSLEAANFYKEVFNGEIPYIMYGKDTPNCPEDQLERVMHLQLKFNENQIYFADANIKPSSAIAVHLDYQDLDEMKLAFDKMKQGVTPIQELGETFWGAVYGVITDKFGVTWQFHYSIPQE